MFSQHGHLTLAHSDRGMITSSRASRGEPAPRHRQLVIVTAEEVKRALPADRHLVRGNLADRRRPVPPARRDHPPRRRRLGLREGRPTGTGSEIHQDTEVTGIDVENGRVVGRRTPTAAGSPATPSIACTAGWSTQVARPGRRQAPDLDEHPAGLRHRAGQAVPRRRHRLLARCTSTSRRPTAASS